MVKQAGHSAQGPRNRQGNGKSQKNAEQGRHHDHPQQRPFAAGSGLIDAEPHRVHGLVGVADIRFNQLIDFRDRSQHLLVQPGYVVVLLDQRQEIPPVVVQ